MSMKVTPTTEENITQLFNSEDVYRMTSPRGRVFIVHNDEFDQAANDDQVPLDDRDGSEHDLDRLRKIFEALDFVVNVHNNLSSQRLFEKFEKEIDNEDHGKYGMFILVLMSHGREGIIYGSDSREVKIDDITRRLSAKNFPAMADKPKMVVIQACAGGEVDNTWVASDHAAPKVETAIQAPSLIRASVTDFIIVHATYPGYKSFRDIRYGSFMIQALTNTLQNFSCHEGIEQLVRRIRNEVLKMCEERNTHHQGAQTVHCSETLRKALYFFPGLTESPSSSSRVTTTPIAECSIASRGVTIAVPSSAESFTEVNTLEHFGYVKNITTPDECWSVSFACHGHKLLHGGRQYGLLNEEQSDMNIQCIRTLPEAGVIQLETDLETTCEMTMTMHEHETDQSPTRSAINSFYSTDSNEITQITKFENLLIQSGANSGKVYIFEYPNGPLLEEVVHPKLKWPRGVCHDPATGDVYVTDYDHHSIFKITLRTHHAESSSSIVKLECDVPKPTGIALRGDKLIVLSNVEPEIYILTTEGRKVATRELPECESATVYDLSVSPHGAVAIANGAYGVQIYEFSS